MSILAWKGDGASIGAVMVAPVFPRTPLAKGMYESFYLRAFSPTEPLGAWLRYTVHKRPGAAPKGSLWCTVFDGPQAPFMHKLTTEEPTVPPDGWIAVGDGSCIGPGLAQGRCGPASWDLRFEGREPELRHLEREWLYEAPLPRTKPTSPCPSALFGGTISLPRRTIALDGWPGMVGHNWGSEHAARWIWLHGLGFEQDESAWIDVALGRVALGRRLTPWLAGGAVSLGGRRWRLGGLANRGVAVAETAQRCTVRLPGRDGLVVEARVAVPLGSAAGWRYADPDGGEHDVVNCSLAELVLNVRPREGAGTLLSTGHGGAYELGMRERDHGVALAPFPDG